MLALTIGTLLVGLAGTSAAAPSAQPSMPSLQTVPNVVGQNEFNATYILTDAGYGVVSKPKVVTHGDCGQNGIVTAQTPRGGTLHPPGTTVTITVLSILGCD
jgi:beta-lactam-binding protein with PASTA domain